MQNTHNDQALKPLVAAMALAFTGSVIAAEEGGSLPELQVEAKKSTGYKAEKSANQKFTAPLIDTPKSVSIITEELIKDSGSLTFQDALRTTPGITFGAGEGGISVGDRPFIRGFDVFNSIYVDGLRDIGSQQREIFAIEQLEVIKGPSGAFDGRGSAGGSINIVTKQARAGNFTSGSVGIGTDRYRRATFDGNYMLGDNAAVRLVGMVHDADTPGRDNVDVKRWGFMPSITLGLEGPTQLTASWYHLETDDVPDWGLPYEQRGGIPSGRPISVSKDNWYGINGRDFHKTSADIGTIKLQHAFSENVTVRNTFRYGKTSNRYFLTRPMATGGAFFPDTGIVNRNDNRNRGSETETLANLTDISIKFDTGSVKHQVNAGIEISKEETSNRAYSGGGILGGASNTGTNAYDPVNDVPYNPVIRNRFASYEAETLNKSAYIFDSMELSDKWLLNAGLRYDSYRNQIKNQNANTGVVTSEFENDKSFYNYQLGAVYRVAANGNIYATWATSSSPVGLANGEFGYAGGGLNADTQDLSPERSRTLELGTKWNVLEDLALTAAVFHTEKTNARVGSLAGDITNRGEAVVKGVEFGAAGKITNQWKVFAGYTYLDAEQTKAGTDADSNQVGSAASKGKQLAGVAKNSASVWTTYDVLPNLTVGGGAFYMDKVYADPANNAYIPSYVRWDAMANYKINDKIDVQLNIQNLTDKRYFSGTYFRHFALVAPGRVGFLSLNFKF
ncbi:TonB-dependent receptor [Methylobacillus pratensis]